MKALSVQQPWANMLACGIKTIETRTWRTHYRGPVLICASQRLAPVLCLLWTPTVPRGVMLAVADLVDCRPMTEADEDAACYYYTDRLFSWVFANVRPVAQRPVKGRLSLFDVPDEDVWWVEVAR
jgi:hypothetical protein